MKNDTMEDQTLTKTISLQDLGPPVLLENGPSEMTDRQFVDSAAIHGLSGFMAFPGNDRFGCAGDVAVNVAAADIFRAAEALGVARRGSTAADPVLAAIRRERERQNTKWGEQNHSDVDPVLTNRPGGATPDRYAEGLEIPTADRARFLCKTDGERGLNHWTAIIMEEVAEAVEAAALEASGSGSPEETDAEIIQVAAVAVQWVECRIRRRQAAKEGK